MSEETSSKAQTLKEVRTAIFSRKRRRTIELEAFGTTLELRQPSLGEILDLQDLQSTKERIAQALIAYCYMPVTGEKIFEDTDMEGIMAMPWDDNLSKIQEAITELTGVNIGDAEKNLSETAADITSS